ncbi:MAG: hypothetical protein ACC608_02410 [Anaerofustis sp.]
MKNRNGLYLQRRAERKKIRRRGFSVLSYLFAAFYAFGGLFGITAYFPALPAVLILTGLGLLFSQGARRAAWEERRYAELNRNASSSYECPAQNAEYPRYYGTGTRAYRRFMRRARRYGYPSSNPSDPYVQSTNRNEEGADRGRTTCIVTTEQEQPSSSNPQSSSEAADRNVTAAQPKRALQETFDQNLSVLEQGRAFAREINKANELIPDEQISQDLNVICEHVKDIFAQAAKDASVERQIRKFGNIYLPQTLKLCNLYIDLQGKRVETKTVRELKDQIAKSIANARCAFTNFNDNLMQQASIDIEAEIKTFESILTIDGLLNRHELVMPEKAKEKEKA